MDALTFNKRHKVMKIIYFSMLLLPSLFLGMAFFFYNGMNPAINPEIHSITRFLVPVILIVAAVYPFTFKKKQLKGLHKREEKDRMQAYQTVMIRSVGWAEGAVLFSCVIFTHTSEAVYLIYAAAGFLPFLMQYPSENKIKKVLEAQA